MQGLLCLWLFAEMIVNWNAMSYLTAVKDYRGILWAFVAAIGISFGLGYLLIFLPRRAGFGGLSLCNHGWLRLHDAAGNTACCTAIFPKARKAPGPFCAGWTVFCHWRLPVCLAIWACSPTLLLSGQGRSAYRSRGCFYGAPYHDVPAMLAFFKHPDHHSQLCGLCGGQLFTPNTVHITACLMTAVLWAIL